MSDYLVQQAIQNVWCTPTQDRQTIIALAKISRYGGAYTSIPVFWRNYQLPEMGKLYHVYQIGGVTPKHLGLTNPRVAGMWQHMPVVCKQEKLIVDLYNVKGIQVPRFAIYYTTSADGDLVVAMEAINSIPIDFNTEQMFLRVYSNAYFDSTRQYTNHSSIAADGTVIANVTGGIEIQGMMCWSSTEILTMQTAYDTMRTKGGTYAFVNGLLVDHIDLLSVKPGDAVEFIFDASIYAIEDLKVSDLYPFDSILDLKRKYLLHPSRSDKDVITYHDDIDVFVYIPTKPGHFNGVYFHRNQLNALRQVTHADYAISIPILNALASNLGWGEISNLTIRLQMRHSGYRRAITYEANRIRELYKLPDTDILLAMVGVDATVPEWQASALENSSYTKVMGSAFKDLTPPLVQDAYGYNAMSLYLAPTPQYTTNVSGQALVDIPPNLRTRSTVYEYNINGHLLGWYTHAAGDIWRAKNTDTYLVEIITGYGVKNLDELFNVKEQAYDSTLDYRMYTCGYVNGMPDNFWQDVTESNQYVISNIAGTSAKKITWLTGNGVYTMVRSNRDFLAYDLEVPISAGVLRFTMTSTQTRDGVTAEHIMEVQMGELDVWLNDRALVEGIDYLTNFPEVIIINKKFIDISKAKQKITLRFCGHSNAKKERVVLGDRGFVQHGVLSNNNRFDIRDDKVLHINVGGGIRHYLDFTFAETHSGVNVPGVPNGTPYVIRDLVVPLRGTVDARTYVARDAALVTDKHVSDYLTRKLPPPTFTEINSITERYAVYSPFCSALITDLASKFLDDERMYGVYSDDLLREMCVAYEPLLQFDPAREPNKIDENYVVVHPTYLNVTTNLTLYQYRFLSRAVKLYLNNAVDLSHFVTVTA